MAGGDQMRVNSRLRRRPVRPRGLQLSARTIPGAVVRMMMVTLALVVSGCVKHDDRVAAALNDTYGECVAGLTENGR